VADVFYLPTKIVFGAGVVAQVGAEAKELGKRALLVSYPDLRKIGMVDRVLGDLKEAGVETVVFDKIEPNPRISTLEEASSFARENKADLVIGLGGGSPMDAAKMVAIGALTTEPLMRYVKSELEIKAALPIIEIPTVASTSSETDHFAAITEWETHEKIGFASPFIFPRVALIDPELTLTLPLKPTLQGAFDIISHTLERYLTTKVISPLTDGINEAVLRMVVTSVPRVIARLDDIEARTQLSWASVVGNSQFGLLGGGGGGQPVHAMEHPLSGYYDIAHGDGLAALFPAWMRSIKPVKGERLASLGRNVFGEEDGVRAMEDWLEKVGMKLRLRDLGISPDLFDEMAESAMKLALPRQIEMSPVPLNKEYVLKIYKESY